MTTFVLATHNAHKVEELRRILGERLGEHELVGYDGPEPVEDGDTFEANALIKARAANAHTGLPAIADDSGIAAEALGGAPGIYSARYAGEGGDDGRNVEKLLGALAHLNDPAQRSARFHATVVMLWPDGREVVAEGSVEGTIATEPRGIGGFGYDPVFVPMEGDGRTFGQMGPDEKHGISHRGRALAELVRLLDD